MIGIIKEKRIFEYLDDSGLLKALAYWCETKGDMVLIITDSLDKVKAIVNAESATPEWFVMPTNLEESTLYHIRTFKKPRNAKMDELGLPGRGEKMDASLLKVDPESFKIYRCPIPKILE